MKVKLTQFNVGKGRRFMAYSMEGDVLRSQPTNGWATEANARRWCERNGHTVVSVERIKDSLDDIKRKYLGDKSLKELEFGQKNLLGGPKAKALYERVNTPEAQKKARGREIARQSSALKSFSKTEMGAKNDKGFVNMYTQAKKDVQRVSVELGSLEETSFKDKGLEAACKKIREALRTYIHLLEQKGNGAISVRR